ncbi:MAG: hypothetical protein KGH74_03615 [Candidatus Micrarchaeota archaeon]|nr:hypothetical protein [Candidatus Micrarchaeota archaeon]
MSEEPHDSAYVYSSTKGKHWFVAGSKVALSERPDKSRGQWILIGLLVVFTVLGATFFGFFLQTTIINPPTQVVGVCPSPAFISGNDCLQKVCTTANNQQVCNLQEAGYIIGKNASRIACTNNICVGVP